MKKSNKYFVYLLMLASFCTLLWFSNFLLGIWRVITGSSQNVLLLGTSIVMLLSVLCWIIWVNGKFFFWKHIVEYPLLFLTYAVYFFYNYLLFLKTLWDGSFYEHAFMDVFIQNSIFIVSFPVITTLWNILLAWIEKKRISKNNILVLLITSLLIPVTSAIISVLLFSQSSLFPQGYERNGLEFTSWVSSGGIFFAFVLYEGVFYLWVKSKLHLKLFSCSQN